MQENKKAPCKNDIRDMCEKEFDKQSCLGLENTDIDLIVFKYCTGRKEIRKKILDFLLVSEAAEEILVQCMNQVSSKLIIKEKKSDVRLEELEEVAKKNNFNILQGQVNFVLQYLNHLK